MKLLVLSNGHGEDEIAIRIIERLERNSKLELAALPIVGQGYAYKKRGIPLAGRVQQMPSGGFIYQGGAPLWQDLRGGLLRLTWEQLRLVRRWGKSGGKILAVGDIVPLFFAWLSGADYAFVGTAKSEYYLRDEIGWLPQTSWMERKTKSVYLPWERWLMSRDRARAVFPRDSLTTKILQKCSVPAYDLGNPMMDSITTTQPRQRHQLEVLLLPGSRMPETLGNWQAIVAAVWSLTKILPRAKLRFLAAIAPGLDLKAFTIYTVTQGWQVIATEGGQVTLSQNDHRLVLSQRDNEEFFVRADIAIAMAGTATEQFVGLGKPAFTFPGAGPQFNYKFAEAQSRLLGCSIILLEHPSLVGKAIAETLAEPELLAQIALNGKNRMGEAGAARRIAECLAKTLFSS